MNYSPLTPREKKIARRNFIVFCGLATLVMTGFAVAATAFING